MIPDSLGAIVNFLKADAGVASLVGTRVFGGELPRAETDSMPRAAIVVRPAGGLGTFGQAFQEYGDRRVDVRCYGTTPSAADAVYRHVHPALKQLSRVKQGSVLLHWARPAGGPLTLRDQDTDWPFTFCAWQVLAAEVTAA